MPQIGFDLEIGVEAEALDVARLKPAPELLGQPFSGELGDVRRHPRDREALGGRARAALILAVLPVGVRHDRLPPDLVSPEEGQVGKEADSTCISRLPTYNLNKKTP